MDTMNTKIHRITPDCQPVFPCWLWDAREQEWGRASFGPCDIYLGEMSSDYTHWHPDQPTAPTQRPDDEFLCDKCGIGYYLPSGRCDHCNQSHARVPASTAPAPSVPLSATPRTDAIGPTCTNVVWDMGIKKTYVFVPADFARALETELRSSEAALAAKDEELAALKADVFCCPPCNENDYEGFKWKDSHDELEKQLAASKAECERLKHLHTEAMREVAQLRARITEVERHSLVLRQSAADANTTLTQMRISEDAWLLDRDQLRAENELLRTRLGAILWSGALDDKTCGQVQEWVKEHQSQLAAENAKLRGLLMQTDDALESARESDLSAKQLRVVDAALTAIRAALSEKGGGHE